MLITLNGCIFKIATGEPDQNGRIYPAELMAQAVEDYLQRIATTPRGKRTQRAAKLARIFNGKPN